VSETEFCILGVFCQNFLAGGDKMTQIIGCTVNDIIYRKGLPCLVASKKGESGKFNIYLNPSIKPKLDELVGKEVLLVEGDFLAQDESIFSPSLIVLWDENGLVDHQLCFD
jgi:hypothetical protein